MSRSLVLKRALLSLKLLNALRLSSSETSLAFSPDRPKANDGLCWLLNALRLSSSETSLAFTPDRPKANDDLCWHSIVPFRGTFLSSASIAARRPSNHSGPRTRWRTAWPQTWAPSGRTQPWPMWRSGTDWAVRIPKVAPDEARGSECSLASPRRPRQCAAARDYDINCAMNIIRVSGPAGRDPPSPRLKRKHSASAAGVDSTDCLLAPWFQISSRAPPGKARPRRCSARCNLIARQSPRPV